MSKIKVSADSVSGEGSCSASRMVPSAFLHEEEAEQAFLVLVVKTVIPLVRLESL